MFIAQDMYTQEQWLLLVYVRLQSNYNKQLHNETENVYGKAGHGISVAMQYLHKRR